MKHKNKKNGFLFILCMLLSTLTFAQQRELTGTVKDNKGEPLPGVSILVKSTSTGTATDMDGKYSLSVSSGDVLVFSFIGYKAQTITIADQKVLDVVLEDDVEQLQEVVVIGYGVAKKNDLTGSVTAIKPDEMNKGLVTNAQDMMQGKIAGVSIINSGGAPGAGATIRIRGGSSLNASNDPLIVIDGLAMDNYGVEGASNPLSLVNPADIETFTVLKDASATAIYGSRASNGVIIITTKKGQKNSRPKISYNGNVSVSTVKNTLDVLNSSEFIDFVQKLSGYENDREGFLNSSEYANLGYYDAEGNHRFANTDWQKEIYRTAISTDHNLTVSGGLENMPYRLSVGYTNQKGIVKNTNYERYTASINVSPSFLKDHLKLNLNAKGMYSESDYTQDGTAIGNATSYDPTKPVYSNLDVYKQHYGGFWQWPTEVNRSDDTWTYGVNTLAPQNPVAAIKLYSNTGKSKVLLGNIEADYKIHGFEDLHLHVNGGLDLSSGKSHKSNSPYMYNSGVYYYGNYGWNKKDSYNMSLSTYAQYIKDINDNHHFDIMAGYEWQHFHIKTDYFYCGYYPSTNLEQPGAQYNPSQNTLYKSENYLVSFYGRLNYTLMNRYMFTATIREDGSSRFSKDNRWGLFPSFAFAWRAKEESFLNKIDALSDAKVRLGYGITGQQEGIGDYTYFASYTPNSQGAFYPVVGEGITYRPDAYNKNLTWEKTTTYNAGIDFGFWNNRLTANIDYYYRKTTDLINTVYVAAGSNFKDKVTSNIGSLHNQGVEVALNYRILQNQDWRWEIGYNLTWNKNKIDKLSAKSNKDYKVLYGGLAVGDSSSDGIKCWQEGQAASAFYTYQQVYDKNGQPIQGEYVDRDGNGIINSNDRYFYKKADADVLMGFTSKLMYKNWDFSFSLRASLNNYMYNGVEAGKSNLSYSNLYSGMAWHNVAKMSMKKNWQEVTTIDALSDYFIQNASFLKCDNITLGYSFNRLFGAKINGRAFLTAQNVFTITKYKGLDPEISGGYDGSLYPRPFVGIFGVSLNF